MLADVSAVAVDQAPDEVRENGASPVYYRLPAGSKPASFRLVLGAADRPAWTRADPRWAFALAINFGIPTGLFAPDESTTRVSPYVFVVDMGYAYASFSEHLGLLGFGPHFRWYLPTSAPLGKSFWEGPIHASLVPHLALGAREGDFAVGIRTSLTLGFSIFGVEISHQLTHTQVTDAHALYFLAGLAGSFESGL